MSKPIFDIATVLNESRRMFLQNAEFFPDLCQMQAMAEDHSERMQPYAGDAGDETD